MYLLWYWSVADFVFGRLGFVIIIVGGFCFKIGNEISSAWIDILHP